MDIYAVFALMIVCLAQIIERAWEKYLEHDKPARHDDVG